MGERYRKLFSLPHKLYADGCPVVIEAGALQLDTIKNQVFAQLKFAAVTDKPIKSIKIALQLKDSADRALGESVFFEYLDLNTRAEWQFGSKTPIMLQNNTVRAFDVTVEECVFGDQSVWSKTDEVFLPLPAQQPLTSVLDTAELVQGYKSKYGNAADWIYQEYQNLQLCTCGAANDKNVTVCQNCKCDLNVLKALDLKTFKTEQAEILEAENQKKKAKEKRKKAARTITLCSIAAVLAIAVFVVMFNPNYMTDTTMLAAGEHHTVGLRSDGTVMAAGLNTYEQIDVDEWTDIVDVAVGANHTFGLKKDGTVVAAGVYADAPAQTFVKNWTDVASITAENGQAGAVKKDGTVIVIGNKDYGQRNVGNWKNITDIALGECHTVGLKKDGTVVAVGDNQYGQCNVKTWENIVAIAASGRTYTKGWTVGLQENGRVVATGHNGYGQCDVYGWTDVVEIGTGYGFTVGLRENGKVVITGEEDEMSRAIEKWTDIKHIVCSNSAVYGVRENGTVVVAGNNYWGQANVGRWRYIEPDNLGRFVWLLFNGYWL